MSFFLILIILALIFAVLSFFLPDKKLGSVATCLIAIALLIGNDTK